LPARAHGFGRDARLTSRLDFQRVFQDGRKTPGRAFTIWSRRDARTGPARLGLSVGAKVGTAVRRARLKRLTRETFRLNREKLAAGSDVVVALRPGCEWTCRADAEKELLDAWRRAGLIA
jgi:ribonuclease P protein component